MTTLVASPGACAAAAAYTAHARVPGRPTPPCACRDSAAVGCSSLAKTASFREPATVRRRAAQAAHRLRVRVHRARARAGVGQARGDLCAPAAQ
eukprot:4780806-Prymnesium_polylepis.1